MGAHLKIVSENGMTKSQTDLWLILTLAASTSTGIWSCGGDKLSTTSNLVKNTEPLSEKPYQGQPSPVQIPLCAGLKIVRAVNEDNADYEAITTVTAVDSGAIQTEVTTGKPDVADLRFFRRIRMKDLASARTYRPYCWSDEPEEIPGTTYFSFSTALHQELRAGKEASFKYRAVSENLSGRARRVGDRAVMHPLVVNNRPLELPAVAVEGVFEGRLAEFKILDDAALPLVLHRRIGYFRSDVVKISFPSSEPVPEIERQLTERGRAEVYDIYFDFAKATLRPESSSVLQQIAAALGRHPSWRVSIQGHTDGIGNDQDNQLLSEHRAEVVRRTLAEDYRISAERLSIEGRGESQPKDTNETLSGRARNRRVELVRY